MARTREFDPDELLVKAVHVFWKNGYAETSMRDIVDATGVAHAGLYNAFGSKRDLYEKCLHQYYKRFSEIAISKLEAEGSGLSDVHRFFEVVSSGIDDGRFATGCLIGNTVIEFGPGSPDILNITREFIDHLTSAFGVALSNAQAKNQFSKSRNVEMFAQFLTTYFYGLMTMVRAGISRKKIHQNLEWIHQEIG
ncbi:MAG: hypothetical protein COC23_00980 [Hyphomicrobiales bacterium]|nr:MAG: hypothetical protein COC23_00980 [Hyphomicrobiales bacterium]